MTKAPANLRADYEAILAGVPAGDGRRTYRFLVRAINLARPGADLRAALGMASALHARGVGVRVVGRRSWYLPVEGDTVVVCLTPEVDPRLVAGSANVIGWVRDRVPRWAGSPGLVAFDAIAAASEIARRVLARHYDGPIGLVRDGFDPDVFHPGGRRSRVWRSLASREDLAGADLTSLPELLQTSRVVACEVPPDSVGYGILGRHLIEALACGALPATNSGTGLQDAGLAAIPVYRTPGQLKQIVTRATSGEFRSVLTELMATVRREFAFERLADDLVALAEQGRNSTRLDRIVDFFPDFRATNPYQSLLYSELDSVGAVAVPVVDSLASLISRDTGGDLTGRVLHLHWLDAVIQRRRALDEGLARYDRFRERLLDLQRRGLRVVWTVHNSMPHELSHYFLEREISEFVADRADVIHVMSGETPRATQDFYRLPADKIVQVDHPSYDGAYPVILDRRLARERLGIAEETRAFLFFGAIRDYKGVARLLDAFPVVSGARSDVRLDVVGRIDRRVSAALRERLVDHGSVHIHAGFIDDGLVQLYLLAADVAVFPYERILNSGSVLLAATFGVPVIVPDTPTLADVADAGFAEMYAPGDTSSLAAALQRAASSLATDEARAAARRFAESRRPGAVSRRFIRSVLGWVPGQHGSS